MSAKLTRGETMKKTYDFTTAKRGPVIPSAGKTRITIHLDNDVLEEFRNRASAEGKGYQTLINDALRRVLDEHGAPVTIDQLRQVLREELHAA